MNNQTSAITIGLIFVIFFGMAFQCGNNNGSGGGKRVVDGDRKEEKGGEDFVDEDEQQPNNIPEIAGSNWQYISVTTKDGRITEATAGNSLRFEESDNSWKMTSRVSYGSGISIDATGTFEMQGNRLILTQQNGQPYDDYRMNWNPDEQILTLVGKSGAVIRLKKM